MVQAKICGLSTPETVRAALDGGAAFLGFAFFPASPRLVQPDLADRLAAPARGRSKIVALLVDPDDASVDQIARTLRPDLIQLHGRETPARVRDVAARTRRRRHQGAASVRRRRHRRRGRLRRRSSII